MKHKNNGERLAYCKNGDCVDELEAILKSDGDVIKGGPLVYISSFVKWGADHSKLVLSRKDRNAVFKNAKTVGRVFKRAPASAGRILGLIYDTATFFKTFINLVLFRPSSVLCAPSGSPMWASYLAAKLCSSTFVHTRHAVVEKPGGYSLKSMAVKITNWIILHADDVICHGPYLENQLLELGVSPSRLHQFNLSYDYLHNLGVNGNTEVGNHINIPGRYILFSGRMTISKGVLDLFHAAEESLRNDHSLCLVYAGDGPATNAIVEAASKAGLEKQVIALGLVDHGLLPELVRNSVFVALPTQSKFGESRCKSAIESIVLGKAVIAPNYGPFPYIIEHQKNGLLFSPDSIIDLGRMIKKLLNSEELLEKLSEGAFESGLKLAESQFTFQDALNAAFSKPRK